MSPIIELLGGVKSYGWSNLQEESGAFNSIQTINVASGGSSSLSFTSIPQTYKHLEIRIVSRGTTNYTIPYPWLQINGNSGANYSRRFVQANIAGTDSLSGQGATAVGQLIIPRYPDTGIANTSYYNTNIIRIENYSDSNKLKTVRATGGFAYGTGVAMMIASGMLYTDTQPITTLSIELDTGSGSWSQHTRAALYGIKGLA